MGTNAISALKQAIYRWKKMKNAKSPQHPNPENEREDNCSCEILSVGLRKSDNLTPSVKNDLKSRWMKNMSSLFFVVLERVAVVFLSNCHSIAEAALSPLGNHYYLLIYRRKHSISLFVLSVSCRKTHQNIWPLDWCIKRKQYSCIISVLP